MTRFLRRGSDEPNANDQNHDDNSRPAVQSAVEPPPRAPTRRGGRRRGSGNGSGGNVVSGGTAGNGPTASSRRGGGRRPTVEPLPADPQERTMALLERQIALLEQQGESIEHLAESQRLLTETLIGSRSGGAAHAQIEVLPRLGVFVDVPNIMYPALDAGVSLDWGKVVDFISEGRTLVSAVAYTPVSDDRTKRQEDDRFIRPFVEHGGFRIVAKEIKRFKGGTVKANCDVELAVDLLTMADRLDVIVLLSGDGDFRKVVEYVAARGVRVEVMAFGANTSKDLLEIADRFFDFAQYVDQLRV